MFRRNLGHLMVASAFVFASSLVGAGSAFAMTMDTTTPGSDLATDVQAGESGEHGTANDVESAEEVGTDDGQVENVVETDNGNTGVSSNTNS